MQQCLWVLQLVDRLIDAIMVGKYYEVSQALFVTNGTGSTITLSIGQLLGAIEVRLPFTALITLMATRV